jgi:hypothetical protein
MAFEFITKTKRIKVQEFTNAPVAILQEIRVALQERCGTRGGEGSSVIKHNYSYKFSLSGPNPNGAFATEKK